MKTGLKNIAWLNGTQFLGALNDNLLKLIIVFFLIRIEGPAASGRVAAVAGIFFVLPFLLFSASAGCIADRFAKSRTIVMVKWAEVAVTALALLALTQQSEPLLYGVVFLMATHSAFFAPAKYGIIPELVPDDRLSQANGMIESATFMAIIFGTALASLLAANPVISGAACVGIAVAGVYAAGRIPRTEAADPARRIFMSPAETIRTLAALRSDRELMLAVAGVASFVGYGAFVQMNLIPYGIERLGLTEAQSGFLFLAAAAGIGAGSILAAKLSGRLVEFGVVPIGAAGLAAGSWFLKLIPANLHLSVVVIVLLGVSAGLFSLPLQTFIQLRAKPEMRGEVVAASTFLNWVAIFVASAVTFLLSRTGVSAADAFAVAGVATLVVAGAAFLLLPDFFIRFLALVLVRTFYRVSISGDERIPAAGPAVLVPNHVTWVDALLLTSVTQRRIRFVMERSIYNRPLLRPLFRLLGVIPVSSTDSRKELAEFARTARQALADGFIVCIFAEGAITRTGMLGEFRKGVEVITKGSDSPVIPLYIGGAWGSIFSYAYGRLLSKLPERVPYPVSLLVGEPLPAAATAADVRQAVTELSSDYFESLKPRREPLVSSFIRTARKNWRREAVADTSGKSLSYGELLAAAQALRAPVEKQIDGEFVGVLLPPSVAGVVTNIALALLGRVAVNLNYTVSAEAFSSALDQCGMRTVITSRAFLEKLPAVPSFNGAVFVEDLFAGISRGDRLRGWLQARFLPARLLVNKEGFTADSSATVIFSSGSTGAPKGVVLSHHNIVSNIEALRMVFRVTRDDRVCGVLPFFHSLGFTATLWFPLVCGFSAVYHTNPLEGEKVAAAVRDHHATILLATPTFLLGYLRRAKNEDFASLRIVMTGAEKLNQKLASSFEEKFGVRPLEGYGATELSPVISLNLPDVEIDGVLQHGTREGSVGRPVPGVAARAVDPETGGPMQPGERGLLLVKGPNVMQGYLNRPEETASAVREGWYVTGDIGSVDADGFITITDRLARFSKIAGEMVPHGTVEDELHALIGRQGVVAVTSVPDERKGERLVVVYVSGETDSETLHRLMGGANLPNLWKPARDAYVAVEVLPVLGSGKLDLRRLREIARDASLGNAA